MAPALVIRVGSKSREVEISTQHKIIDIHTDREIRSEREVQMDPEVISDRKEELKKAFGEEKVDEKIRSLMNNPAKTGTLLDSELGEMLAYLHSSEIRDEIVDVYKTLKEESSEVPYIVILLSLGGTSTGAFDRILSIILSEIRDSEVYVIISGFTGALCKSNQKDRVLNNFNTITLKLKKMSEELPSHDYKVFLITNIDIETDFRRKMSAAIEYLFKLFSGGTENIVGETNTNCFGVFIEDYGQELEKIREYCKLKVVNKKIKEKIEIDSPYDFSKLKELKPLGFKPVVPSLPKADEIVQKTSEEVLKEVKEDDVAQYVKKIWEELEKSIENELNESLKKWKLEEVRKRIERTLSEIKKAQEELQKEREEKGKELDGLKRQFEDEKKNYERAWMKRGAAGRLVNAYNNLKMTFLEVKTAAEKAKAIEKLKKILLSYKEEIEGFLEKLKEPEPELRFKACDFQIKEDELDEIARKTDYEFTLNLQSLLAEFSVDKAIKVKIKEGRFRGNFNESNEEKWFVFKPCDIEVETRNEKIEDDKMIILGIMKNLKPEQLVDIYVRYR